MVHVVSQFDSWLGSPSERPVEGVAQQHVPVQSPFRFLRASSVRNGKDNKLPRRAQWILHYTKNCRATWIC